MNVVKGLLGAVALVMSASVMAAPQPPPLKAGLWEMQMQGGSALAGPCANCAYTFAGTFTAPTGAQVPEGYDLQVDGGLVVESAVAVENVNWGSLKALFNSGR